MNCFLILIRVQSLGTVINVGSILVDFITHGPEMTPNIEIAEGAISLF